MDSFIAVHSGAFHADDVLCIALLRLLPKFETMRVVRTRDPDVISSAYLAADVGGLYDHAALRYDHHQKGFDERFDERSTVKMAGVGLIWRHYGLDILRQLYPDLDSPTLCHTLIYNKFIKAIDAIDNGQDAFTTDGHVAFNFIDQTSLSARISRLSRRAESTSLEPQHVLDEFMKAVAMAQEEFLSFLDYFLNCELSTYHYFMDVSKHNKEILDSGKEIDRVLVVDHYVSVNPLLAETEELMGITPDKGIAFVIIPRGTEQWTVDTVCVKPGLHPFRVGLREEWRGRRDFTDRGCNLVFVHSSGFMGVTPTVEDAVKAARLSLNK